MAAHWLGESTYAALPIALLSWHWVDGEGRKHAYLDAGDIATALAVASYADPQGSAYAGATALALRAGLTERRVRGHLARLEQLGVLAVERRPGHTHVLRITPDRRTAPDDATVPDDASRQCHVTVTPGRIVRTVRSSRPGRADELTDNPNHLTKPLNQAKGRGDDAARFGGSTTPTAGIPEDVSAEAQWTASEAIIGGVTGQLSLRQLADVAGVDARYTVCRYLADHPGLAALVADLDALLLGDPTAATEREIRRWQMRCLQARAA